MVAPVEALAAMPEALSDAKAAPLLCAGITSYNAHLAGLNLCGEVVVRKKFWRKQTAPFTANLQVK